MYLAHSKTHEKRAKRRHMRAAASVRTNWRTCAFLLVARIREWGEKLGPVVRQALARIRD